MGLLGKLLRKPWMKIPLIIIGILCLFAAIWFGFPMIPLEIFQTIWLRATVIGLLLAIILLVQILKWRKRRAAAKAMEDELMTEPEGDGKILTERMSAALAKLKKSGGSTYLYDLPWYIIIGPPGAGKTTALLNSGIEFPASEADKGGMEGFGGTRYCDWWFAEDAILIDTAGRYTTQDSDAVADKSSWTSFLELLKRTRPNQPINGVLLAFSAEDMMTASDDELQAHANTVRERLAELHETLRIDFPVYVLFTKSDLIAGFREYFASFNINRRKSVWGVTFQTKDRKATTHEDVGPEFDKLVSRLSDELMDRLSEEPDAISRISIFGLPGQMALMRDNISEFLRRVFAPSNHKTNAILRGFYFTSGTQEGTPIDQVLGAMAERGGTGADFAPSFMSGQGKSFFIHDLLKRVVFAERDWVSHDARAVRRTALLRTLAFSTIAVLTLGALGAFGWSFWQNYQLVESADAEAGSYARTANDEIMRTEIDDPNLEPILPYLEQLRLMPAGYGTSEEPGFWEGLGLSQRERLSVAADSSYGDALEQMLRPRLILDVEQALPEIRRTGEPADIYRALKVYMLLGGQAPNSDDDAIKAWFEDVWREDFTGINGIDQRDQLARHLDAMLELDDERDVAVAIDQEAIVTARSAIVQMSLADQAWALISDRSKAANLPDFSLAEQTGPQSDLVFTTKNGDDLSTLVVPGLFTYEGYWGFFFEQLLDVGAALERDKWVLGDQADQVDFDGQLRGLDQALQARYGQEFRAAWQTMFDNIALENLAADKPQYDVLAAASAPFASPILQLVKAVDGETKLSREIERIAAAAEQATGGDGGGGVLGQLGEVFASDFRRRSDRTTRVLLDAAQDSKNQNRVNGQSEGPLRPVQRIEQQFEEWHVLLEGPEGQRPIDIVLADLAAIRDNLRLGATNPGQSAALLPQLLSNLTRNNSRLPETVRNFVNEAERDFRGEAADANLAEMNRALNNDITFTCREVIASSFPFADSPRHLPPAAFGQFFGPGGAMDQYFNTYLAQHVIRTGDGLSFDPNSPLADRLSQATLRQFDRAEKIRLAFFGSGSPMPEVQISVRHMTSHNTIQQAQMDINGQLILTAPGDPAKTVVWPGGGGSATVQVFPALDRESARGFQNGPWSIIQLLNVAASRQPQGNGERVTFQIGGRPITYDFAFNAVSNPFTMRELREFSCPQSLD